MTHEIEVKVKVENIAGEIVFFVSDMPRVESSVRKSLMNFATWQYAKWTENGQAHCIYSHDKTLAQDTIRIALNIAGIGPNSMNQFERASALLDMATEYKAMANKRQREMQIKAIAHYEKTWQGKGL